MSDEIPKLELNQPLAEDDYPVRVEKNPFILALGEPCVERRLQEVLGINPKTWNDLKNKGILPQRGTYGEMLTKVFKYYWEQEGVAMAKTQAIAERNANGKGTSTDSGLPKVVEAEKLQKIRLDKAREEEVHLKNLQTRGLLLSKPELLELISPLISNIANVLRNAGDDNPTLQPFIDKCFVSLFETGLRLCQQADQDSERYVREMLARNIDLDELIANADLEII